MLSHYWCYKDLIWIQLLWCDAPSSHTVALKRLYYPHCGSKNSKEDDQRGHCQTLGRCPLDRWDQTQLKERRQWCCGAAAQCQSQAMDLQHLFCSDLMSSDLNPESEESWNMQPGEGTFKPQLELFPHEGWSQNNNKKLLFLTNYVIFLSRPAKNKTLIFTC